MPIRVNPVRKVGKTKTGAKGVAPKSIKRLIPFRPKAAVYFRPDTDVGSSTEYKGEFGFDWMREDDVWATEPDYKSIIDGGYKDGVTDLNNVEAYEALKKEYRKLPIWGFSQYFVPYLNLFPKTYADTITTIPKPPCEAVLEVFVEIKEEEVDELRFEYNKDIFSINGKSTFSLPDKAICPMQYSSVNSIKITCKKEITTNKDGEIEVYAYPKGSLAKPEEEQTKARKLAGKILVGKNDEKNRKEVGFVLVSVLTDITGGNPKPGVFSEIEKMWLYRILHQALVHPLISEKRINLRGQLEDVVLDLTGDRKFQTGGTYVSGGNIIKGPTGNDVVKYLDIEFMKDIVNTPYLFHIPIFVLAEPGGRKGELHGYSDGDWDANGNIIRALKNSVLFTPAKGTRTEEGMAHEALHGFQLFHTHRDGNPPLIDANQKYIYPNALLGNTFNATDNIMSYNFGKMRTTWHWQWEIIKRNW